MIHKIPLNIRPDQASKAGYIYPLNVLKKAVEQYMTQPFRFGTLYQTEVQSIALQDMAFYIEKAEILEDNSFLFTIRTVDTDKGRELDRRIATQAHVLHLLGYGEIKKLPPGFNQILQVQFYGSTCEPKEV